MIFQIYLYIILLYIIIYKFNYVNSIFNSKDNDIIINDLPDNFFQNEFIFINIGGVCSKEGWYNINGNNITCPDGNGGTDIIRYNSYLIIIIIFINNFLTFLN